MEVIISNQLKEYMKNKNKNEITIDLPMRKVCCSGPYLPFVKFGKPKNKHTNSTIMKITMSILMIMLSTQKAKYT